MHRYAEAIRFYERAAGMMEADANAVFMLICCYTAAGMRTEAREAAQRTLRRTDAILARDQDSAVVIAYSAYALATLGEGERAKARMSRALLIDPDNFRMRYNFACALSAQLKDIDAAFDMLASVFKTVTEAFLPYVKADPDFEFLRDDPRFQAMVAAADARLAAAKDSAAPTATAD